MRFFWKKQRVKTPTVIQMEATECGAAALSMILGYYGRFVSLEELRVECGVSRSGVNALNMIEAANHYGLDATGYEVPLPDIQEVSLPAIVFWNYSHFVVLEGLGKDGAYINDPATGPRFVGQDELEKSYSQVVLEMKPTSSFVKGGKKFAIFEALKTKMRPYQRYLVYLLLLQFALIFFGLAVPIFFQVFIDKILPNPEISWKSNFFVFFALTAAIIGFLTWSSEKFLNLFRVKVSNDLSSHFLWHVLHLPISFFSQRYGGEVIQRTQLNNDIANAVIGPLLISAINLILIGLYLAIIAAYSVPIAMIGLGAGLFNLLVLAYVNRIRTSAYADFQQKQAKVIGVSLDTLSSIETIKTNNAESTFFNRIANLYAVNINALQLFAKKDAWLHAFSSLSQNLSNTLLLGIGIWYVLEGIFTVGMLIGLQVLLNMFLHPFNQLVDFGALLQSLRVDINRVDDVLRSPQDQIFVEKESKADFEKFRGELALKRVTFGYSPRDKPILADCSFTLKKREWVALVGSVGSGKSTLARIACQLYLPWSGEVLYDGVPSGKFSLHEMKKNLSLVDQELILFAGTVKDNLTLWDEALLDADITKAAKDACIHRDILERGNGYDALIAEGGTNFSHGQQQRLEIARALVRNPALLIMDEATNALDEETEYELISNLRKRDLSCFLISHRLSAISRCDRIVVLSEGVIVQEGTLDQLSNVPGLFQDLVGGQIIG